MKTKITLICLIVVLLLSLNGSLKAQTQANPAPDYKEGHVWTIAMVQTKAGMTDEYLKQLKATLKKVDDEAVKEGLILSYKILLGTSANPNDYDVMLMEEYKDMAAMDGLDDKWKGVFVKTVGDDEAMKKLMQTRTEVRTIYGDKIMREVMF